MKRARNRNSQGHFHRTYAVYLRGSRWRLAELLSAVLLATSLSSCTTNAQDEAIQMWVEYSLAGRAFDQETDFTQAIRKFLKCQEASRNISDPNYMAESLYLLGRCYCRAGNVLESNAVFERALALLDKVSLDKHLSCEILTGSLSLAERVLSTRNVANTTGAINQPASKLAASICDRCDLVARSALERGCLEQSDFDELNGKRLIIMACCNPSSERFEQALQSISSAAFPRHTQLQVAEAYKKQLLKQGRTQESEKLTELIDARVSLHPGSMSLFEKHLCTADDLLNQKDYQEVVDLCQTVIDSPNASPLDLALAWQTLGNTYSQLHEWRKSVECFETELQLLRKMQVHNIELSEPLIYLLNTYLVRHEFARAEPLCIELCNFLATRQSSQEWARRMIDLGVIYNALGKRKLAEQAMQAGLSYMMEHAEFDKFNRALEQLSINNPDMIVYRHVLEGLISQAKPFTRAYSSVLLKLAMTYVTVNATATDYSKAEQMLNSITSERKSDIHSQVFAHILLGDTQFFRKDYGLACAQYKAAIKLLASRRGAEDLRMRAHAALLQASFAAHDPLLTNETLDQIATMDETGFTIWDKWWKADALLRLAQVRQIEEKYQQAEQYCRECLRLHTELKPVLANFPDRPRAEFQEAEAKKLCKQLSARTASKKSR